MNSVKMKARAKINISLDVIRKREDGYHDLSMIMQTVDLFDKVNIKKIKKPEIVLKTNIAFLPVDERNLVYKIVDYMRKEYSIKQGVYIDLFKVIPIAAGLAGGSSDAAAAIKGMNQLFDLGLSIDEMQNIGRQFGSDIPYCIIGGTVMATGIGEKLTYLDPFPECHVVIAKPSYGMSTRFVYENLALDQISKRPNNERLVEAIKQNNLQYIAGNMCNVLESVTIKEYPEIEKIKETMLEQGALGSLMSGSGTSVFGLFQEAKTADKCIEQLKNTIKLVYKTTIYNRKRGR